MPTPGVARGTISFPLTRTRARDRLVLMLVCAVWRISGHGHARVATSGSCVMSEFKQADRHACDGRVSVDRAYDDGDLYTLTVEHDGVVQTLTMSAFNASRVFVGIACMLRIPLSQRVQKEIKL